MEKGKSFNRRVAILALSVALAVATSAWLVLRRPTLEGVASNSFAAIIDADGATLLDNMAKEEASAYSLSGSQWTRFLTEYARPIMSRWTAVNESKREYQPAAELLAEVHSFFTPSGRTAGLRVQAARTEDGPKTVGLPVNLLTCLAAMKFEQPKGTNSRLALFQAIYKLCIQDKDTLTGLGLHGMYDSAAKKIETWDDLQVVFGRSIDRLARRLKQQK